VSLQSLIDELEQMVDRARHIPASGKVVIDEAAVRQMIDQMRLAAGDEAKAGQRVTAERDRILADAKAQARRIVEEAQTQAASRLDDQTAIQLARERARVIVADAEQQAGRMRAEANTYVANQLNSLENRLTRLLHEVQAGQRFLTQPPPDKPAQGETSRQS
jgi:vacuolar-type H+-ATPase subunit H